MLAHIIIIVIIIVPDTTICLVQNVTIIISKLHFTIFTEFYSVKNCTDNVQSRKMSYNLKILIIPDTK